MKGDIISNLIKLLQNKEVGQTFRYTYLQSTGAKTAYLFGYAVFFVDQGI